MGDVTIANLIDLAISWEMAARDLYATVSEAFPSQPSVAETWRQMAIDESAHAGVLQNVRASLPEGRLAQRLGATEAALIESMEHTLAQVRTATPRTLDEVYELAHILESSEVNAVFKLVISFHIGDGPAGTLVDAQLEEHLGKLRHLARHFDRAARRSILIQS